MAIKSNKSSFKANLYISPTPLFDRNKNKKRIENIEQLFRESTPNDNGSIYVEPQYQLYLDKFTFSKNESDKEKDRLQAYITKDFEKLKDEDIAQKFVNVLNIFNSRKTSCEKIAKKEAQICTIQKEIRNLKNLLQIQTYKEFDKARINGNQFFEF